MTPTQKNYRLRKFTIKNSNYLQIQNTQIRETHTESSDFKTQAKGKRQNIIQTSIYMIRNFKSKMEIIGK